MSDPSDIYLPPHLPYPIKITALAAPEAAEVQRGTRLLSYSFTHVNADKPELRFGTWDASVEGSVAKWYLHVGDTISQRKARDSPALAVTEPCKHGIQLGGLCCICGKDMTDFDYTGFSDASRASIQMTHSASGPTVSFEEAQRIERETAEHLLKSRKLSLIVDLDQTIVHATVDPTVGEWIAEGEAWEARHANQNGSTSNGTTTPPDGSDEVNPNWDALKDVKKFKLGPEALGQTGKTGKNHSVESEGCMYYIKPRPGWQHFLSHTASKYEMHVYTMGTRAYAEEVCAAIDPDGKLFGGRILSRDESGSLTQKSLQRLFPCDQSMVVIIDDRADVWEWSPNLVKVIPYDFFVGIGDINSAFLPKLEPMTPALPQEAPQVLKPTSEADEFSEGADISSQLTEVTEESPSPPASSLTVDGSPTFEEVEQSEIVKNEILTRNHMALDQQVEERPLAKKQEELQTEAGTSTGSSNGTTPAAKGDASTSTAPKPAARKALLKNDDIELTRVQNLLDEVHRRYFVAHDAKGSNATPKRKPGRRLSKSQVDYDVRIIIPQLRQLTLDGVHILFSSVIPLDTRPESTEIWRTALAFGAQCYTELSAKITHVVAAKRGTVKVDSARRQGGIKIVWLSWFTDSVAFWHRQDESPYLMDPEPAHPSGGGPASPPSDPHQISSDPEPDADDWDEDARRPSGSRTGEGEGGGGEGLELDEVDWSAVNDEVEAAMNESDDEDERSERSVKFGNGSEDEGSWSDETNSMISSVHSTPRGKRKRLRSITPSDGGRSVEGERDALRSPLAKRKKIVADRSGQSKLKEAFSAADFKSGDDSSEDAKTSKASTPTGLDKMDEAMDEDEEDDEDDEEDGDDDDDFLARELGEDWG
ncbi:Carboxy-terminal domain (CTD) phosphatase [Steccherinum ochraceum]|uniref:RNA polymerase II subunit A C-terminal domain phosphatase n=1 Tax=Steccherinum ochraceum TaxID=92696 RepID=A0A4R0RMR4_9APHY|nr:Carboxy-terminal domain (CTD) phosphatase [Steccherinum ochraceum]